MVPKERIGELIDKLRGRAMYARAITSSVHRAAPRRSPGAAWSDVDLDAKVMRVREALEETREHGIRVKATKTKAGRRDVSLPEIVVDALREHRRQQLELRMALGARQDAGRRSGVPAPSRAATRRPRAFSKEWARVAASIGFPASRSMPCGTRTPRS